MPTTQKITRPAPVRWLSQLFNGLVIGYGFLVAGFLALNLLAGERWHIVAFFKTFAHLILWAAPVLFFWCLLLRRWRPLLALLPAMLAFVWWLGPMYYHVRLTEERLGPARLNVLTYNIQWRAGDYTPVAEVILAADADVVAVQELGHEAAVQLAGLLAEAYPHQALYPQDWGIYGQGVFSRYPVLESAYWQSEGAFGNQRAVIAYENIEIAVYNVHPVHPGIGGSFFDPTLRGIGITDIMETMDADAYAYRLLLGDFNMPELSDDYERITLSYRDAFRSSSTGMGLTYAYNYTPLTRLLPPLLRLDYIFSYWTSKPVAVRVLSDTGGSDHLPVWAQIDVNLDPTAS